MAFSSSLHFSLPSSALFKFPPAREPEFLVPPPPGSPSGPPFDIPDHVYQGALDASVPITCAILYVVSAKALNAYNRGNGMKPWAVSKTRAFHVFVVAHNLFLAVYSAWTFWGMVGALRRSVVNPLLSPGGLAALTDSLCRLNGPAGLGRGAQFSEVDSEWSTGTNGSPSRLDGHRIWNEGLAFYGWVFYLSKFYEVLDTFIILAKGKSSSTLQTYHHTGAIMCMWAGMRYMSPPIWMFVMVNSFIHALMYTYYTITTFNVRVPVIIKRTLTSMQITQFLVGASYAMLHSFVSYEVPVAEAASQIFDQPAAVPSNATTGGAVPDILPAVASVLVSLYAMVFGADASQKLAKVVASPQSPGTEHARVMSVPCITTSGATFAIWLNVLYLAPLTYLFAKFFVTSYLRHSSADGKTRAGKRRDERDMQHPLSNEVEKAEKAGWDAARRVEREVYGQDGVEEMGPVTKGKGRELRRRA